MVPLGSGSTKDVDVVSAIKGQPALSFTNTTRNLPEAIDEHLLKLENGYPKNTLKIEVLRNI